MIQHPTPESVQKVIDNLESVAHMANSHLDMDKACVTDYAPDCGTMNCVGGWYAIAVKNKKITMAIAKKNCIFWDGAKAMAEDLGFNFVDELKDWAKENADIWGNKYGFEMFSTPRAYNKKHKELDFSHIIDYWKGVKNRLKKGELKYE